MEHKLIEYFSKMTTLSEAEKAILLESMVIETYKKGDCIVQEGKDNENTFFVLEGLVKQSRLVDGEDISTNFYTEMQWIIAPNSFSGQSLSQHSLTCMEGTSVVVGNEAKAITLFKQFPRFETISRQIMETAFLAQQNLTATYITDKPEQRYLRLLDTRPDILQRVPQYDIATYIGVKPESLSRIRKKLHQKNKSN